MKPCINTPMTLNGLCDLCFTHHTKPYTVVALPKKLNLVPQLLGIWWPTGRLRWEASNIVSTLHNHAVIGGQCFGFTALKHANSNYTDVMPPVLFQGCWVSIGNVLGWALCYAYLVPWQCPPESCRNTILFFCTSQISAKSNTLHRQLLHWLLEDAWGCSRVLCRRMALNKCCIMVPPLRLYESRIFDLTLNSRFGNWLFAALEHPGLVCK